MEATASKSEREDYRLQENDVIVTKDSETADDIAVPTFVERDLEDVVCGYHLALIRPFKNCVNGRYLYYCFSASNIAKQFHVAANGVTRFGLSLQSLKGGEIPVPPLGEQQMIADQLDRASERTVRLVEKIETAIEKLREYRSALITAAVTGKIDLRNHAA